MKLKTWLGMGAVVLAAFAVNAQEMSDEAIKERIKPVGSVHVAGAAAAAPAAAAGYAIAGSRAQRARRTPRARTARGQTGARAHAGCERPSWSGPV